MSCSSLVRDGSDTRQDRTRVLSDSERVKISVGVGGHSRSGLLAQFSPLLHGTTEILRIALCEVRPGRSQKRSGACGLLEQASMA